MAYENAKAQMYISCMPLSGSSYRFKVLIFSRASFNHWAGVDNNGAHSYLSYKVGNNEVKLCEFWGKNYDDVKVDHVREAWVKPEKGHGVFTVNEVLLTNGSENTCKTLPASNIEGGQASLFLQIDWTPDYNDFKEKEIKSLSVFCHVYDECKGEDIWRNYDLGKFSYNSPIQQPRLIQPYIDIDAPKEEQGRMVLTWTTMKECDSLTYTLDGKEVKLNGSFANSGNFNIPQTNSVRTVSIDAKMYQDENRKSPIVLTSNSVVVKPYQGMSSFAVSEIGGTKENNYVNRGFNKMEWTIDYPSATDYIPGDQFVLKRGYSSDFSDAETIETVSILSPTGWETEIKDGKVYKDSATGKDIIVKDTIITKAIFTYIDSTVGAYRNRDAEDKTIVFPFSAEDVVLNENGTYSLKAHVSPYPDTEEKIDNFFKHFVTHNRKVYYSVERASASSLFADLNEKYQRKDSVAKTKQLPLITKLEVQKTLNWGQNHKTAITIRLDNFCPINTSVNLLDYVGITSNSKQGVLITGIMNKYGMTDRMYDWDTNARILLWRHTRELNDSILIEVPSDSVRLSKDGSHFEVEVRDVQPDAFLHYYYTACVDASQSYLPIAECLNVPVSKTTTDSLYYEGAAHIKSFEATTDQTDGIRLTWSRYDGSFSAYQLQRKSEDSDAFEKINVDPKELEKGYYLDTTAKRGKEYEYRLVLLFNHYGLTFQDERFVVGKRAPYAIVKGKVKTSNGVGVAGITMAVVSSSKNLCGAEVMKDSVVTQADGSYEARVVACEDDVTITVTPSSGKLEFYTAASAAQRSTVLSSTLAHSDYSGVDFILKGGNQFVGRVLYKNSTIPVADATFKVNGKTLYNAAGKLLKTDAYGNFSFTVPQHEVTIQVEKEGHQFENNGYIHEKDKSASDTTFTPDGDYVGLELVDNTRIRLIGKISGGATQGAKQMGFGELSGNENVLGDSITLVLQLEGDNTAQFVFLKSTPDNTTIDTTYQHYADTVGKTVVGATKVSYQKKRIVVVADNKTGEFALDLFPARYKIIQMYANGYSTLFAPNEGAQVLDLTDPALLERKTDTLKVGEKSYYTRYNAMYKRIYHCPATLTYQQMLFGLERPYLGDEQVASVGLMSDLHLVTTATMNPETKAVSYLFKHPVFSQDVEYTLKVSAREDYYYNNEKKDSHLKDSVPVSYGTLNINNGLTKNGKIVSLKMDSLGRASFSFKADNPTFTMSGENALRTMNLSVEVADYYYDAEPLKAYVLGTRRKGSDAVVYTSENADLAVLDVLRDPPGSKSYSFLGKGAKYTFSHSMEFDLKIGVNLSFSYGTNYTAVTGVSAGAGPFTGMVTNGKTDWAFDLPIPIYNFNNKRNATYDYVVNETIKTSGAEGETGSMYDVYIGTGINVRVERVDAFSTIDHEQYQVSKPAIESGAIKVVAASADSVDGHPSAYIVINELLDYQEEYPTYFAYTQKYILGTLLPKLVLDRDALLKDTTEEALMEIYQKTKTVQYKALVPDSSDYYGIQGGYKRICDNSNTEDKVANINNQIRFWMNMIYLNDSIKVKTIKQDGVKKNYSISSGTDVNYKENSSLYDSDNRMTHSLPLWNNHAGEHWLDANSVKFADAGIGALGKILRGTLLKNRELGGDYRKEEANIQKILNQFKRTFYLEEDENGTIMDETEDSKNTQQQVKEQATTLNLPGASFKFRWKPTIDLSYNDKKDWKDYTNLERGFYLGTTGDSYMDIQVFPITAVSFANDSKYQAELDSIQEAYNKSLNWSAPWAEEGVNENSLYVHDFVFSVKGGATRPYEHPDSTVFYKTGTPLGHPTMKIDNPKIQVLNPIRGNVPSDESVFFDLVLTNESEVPSGLNMKQGSFSLKVDDKSNPNGLKVYIDGAPLSNEYTIKLRQGETIRKTIEVVRGTASDYENVALMFKTGTFPASLTDMGYFSVHYVPTSTPLTITSPIDKWVLNTLQPKDNDSTGYYLSVDVEGFDLDPLHYPNFDHIEIQYKETNKGEDAWVNLCSFYNDSTLYEQASGAKEKISGNNAIKGFKFYGGKDPIEMRYDIRAVSFSRLGNSFVTRSSNVVSGIKDTRCPRVFGNAEPTNGVLMYGDVIRLPFTEPIAYNYLDKTANFSVLGYVNNQDIVSNGTCLKFDGKPSQSARSIVARSLVNRSFTVDMMVRANNDSFMTLFSHGEQEEGMMLGIEGRRLVASISGVLFSSDTLEYSTEGTLTRVGMMYNNRTHNVTFFEGNKLYPNILHDTLSRPYHGNGLICLGTDADNTESTLFSGSMKEVRLWNDTLSMEELTAYNGITQNGYAHQLIAHYPLDETHGTTASDVASGANLELQGTTWDIKMGHSLRIDGKAITADPSYFQRNATSSYTMMFWFKTDNKPATDTITIFSAGKENISEEGMNKLAIRYEGTNLVVRSKGISHVIGNDYADAKWHSMSLAVNRAHNVVTVYMDGQLAAQFEASEFEGISSDYVALGSDKFIGNIDDLSLWDVVLPADYIRTHYNAILKGDEQDLAIYLPFCHNAESDQGLATEPFSPYNEVKVYDQNISLHDSRTLILTNTDSINDDQITFAPLRKRKTLEKLDFDWSSNGTDLLINILTDQKKYNHQNIYLTVRNVEDVNGNAMKNAEMWSVYTDLNQLSWLNYYYDVEIKYGETNLKDRTFGATIYNYSGTNRNYVIQSNEPWLTPLKSRGECEPDDMTYVEFEISDNLNPGEYVDYVTLTDENGLYETMEVHIKVVADEPIWNVEKANATMNYIGVVKIQSADKAEIFDTNPNDIISAFVDSKCVGKANLSINHQTGESRLFMTIYGDSTMISKKSPISFRLWNSRTGEIMDMISDSIIEFIPNTIIGCPPSSPDTLRITGSSSQQLKLSKGWNWISMNIIPTPLLNNLFAEPSLFADNDQIKRDQFASFSKTKQKWVGPMAKATYHMSRENVYQVYVENPGTYSIVGTELPDSLKKVSVKGGVWNDLAYPLTITLPLINALADFPIGTKAQVGDVIKCMDLFAVAKGPNEWIGTLDAMRPGCGYFLYHRGADCEITFKSTYAGTRSGTSATADESSDHRYSNNMPVMAMFDKDVDAQDEDVLVAYVDDEKVGEAKRFDVDGSAVYFLSVQANDGDIVTFAQQRDGETLAKTKTGVIYDASAIVGTLNEPYIVSFVNEFVTATPRLFDDEVEFVIASEEGADVTVNVYSADGRVVWNHAVESSASVTRLTMNGSALTSGVYMANVRVNDKEQTIKLVRK